MIILFSGTPGSGKSLHAAQCIYDTLSKTDRAVCANFRINPNICGSRNFHFFDNERLTPDLLMDFSAWWYGKHKFSENGILLVIDEAQLLFNCRDSIGSKMDTQKRLAWVAFMSQHRKYGYRIILVSQADRFLDKQFRFLLEQECQHRNLSNMGFKGTVLRAFFMGGSYLATWRYYGVAQIINQEIVRGSKKLFALYDSYGTFAREQLKKERKTVSQPVFFHEQETQPLPRVI